MKGYIPVGLLVLITLLGISSVKTVNAGGVVQNPTPAIPTNKPATTSKPPTTSTIHGAGPHYHPIYRYSCNEDLTVTFKGVNGTVQYFQTKNGNAKPSACNITPVGGHFGNFKLTKDCLTTPDDQTAKRFVYVSVVDKNEGEPQAKAATLNPNIIIGGRHVFKLTCLPIPKAGVERYALAETGVHDLDVMGQVYNEVADVDMRFKEAADEMSPDISEVYIGDMFFMYIKYMGARPYTLLPMACTAYQGTYRLTDGTLLWNMTNGCLSSAATTYKILDSFIRDDKKMVHAKLHGFRFASKITGEEDDITISCVVKMCTGNSGECADKCSVTTPATNRRRRRQSETNQRLKTISRTFKVKNRTNSGGRAQLAGGLVCIVAVAVFLQSLF